MRGWTAEDEGRKANRIPWLDAVKGVGIICVILGHMTIPETLRQFVFSFHMPLFFFVSGYLYHGRAEDLISTGLSWGCSREMALVLLGSSCVFC